MEMPPMGGGGGMTAPPDPNKQSTPSMPTPGIPGEKPEAKQQRLNPIKLTPEQINDFWSSIEKMSKRVEARSTWWDMLMTSYLPIVTEGPEAIKINAHFRNVQTKIGQLFVRSPEIRLQPMGPALDQVVVPNPQTGELQVLSPGDVVPIKQAVLNNKLGPEEIDGLGLMDECLFDMMAWAGIACVKVGYRATQKPVPKPVMVPDPNAPPPAAPVPNPGAGPLGLGAGPVEQGQPPMVAKIGLDGKPEVQWELVTLHEEWYADRFSPKKVLVDELLKTPRVAKYARMLGMVAYMDKKKAMKDFGLTDQDFQSGAVDDDVFEYDDDKSTGASEADKNLVKIYELWCKASHFLDEKQWPQSIHPEAIFQIILVEGVRERTIVCRPSPDQTFDEMGMLTPDSLKGFPIKIGSLRVMTDTPFPMCDSAFTNAQAKHLDTDREQSVKLKDANIGKYAYDTEALDNDDLVKIKQGAVGEYIGLKGGMLQNGIEKVIAPIAQLKPGQDDQRLRMTIKSDMDETLGISAPQAGGSLDTVRSATEVNEMSQGAAGRIEKEQSRAIAFYLEIVRAVDKLLVRYADQTDYVTIAGDDGAQRMMMWNNKIISGDYGYSIKPDSQLHMDAARDRQQRLALYNITAQDPLVNRVPVLRDLFGGFGYDPTKVVLPFNPALGQPPAGGPVNKHESENSGKAPGGPQSNGDNRTERNTDRITKES